MAGQESQRMPWRKLLLDWGKSLSFRRAWEIVGRVFRIEPGEILPTSSLARSMYSWTNDHDFHVTKHSGLHLSCHQKPWANFSTPRERRCRGKTKVLTWKFNSLWGWPLKIYSWQLLPRLPPVCGSNQCGPCICSIPTFWNTSRAFTPLQTGRAGWSRGSAQRGGCNWTAASLLEF
jgi:hypothetical protein